MRPPALDLVADRRAREGAAAPTLSVRGPLSAHPRPAPAARAPADTRSPARRVEQATLLAELERLSQGRGLSYAERRRLGAHIDTAYVDAEVARHERHLRLAQRYLLPAALLYAAGVVAFAAWLGVSGGADADWSRLVPPLALSPTLGAIVLSIRHTRRRRHVLMSLRALATDAP